MGMGMGAKAFFFREGEGRGRAPVLSPPSPPPPHLTQVDAKLAPGEDPADARPSGVPDEAVVPGKVGVGPVLGGGFGQAVADGKARQGDGGGDPGGGGVVGRDAGGDGGDVVPRVRLPRHEKGVADQGRL